MITPYTETLKYPLTGSGTLVWESCTRATEASPWSDWTFYDQKAMGYSATATATRDGIRDSDWRENVRKSVFSSHPYNIQGYKMDAGAYEAHFAWEQGVLCGLDGTPATTGKRLRRVRAHYTGSLIDGVARLGTTGSIVLPPTSLRDVAKVDALASAKEGALQVMVSLMEGPKTFRMFGDTVARLAHLIRVAHRLLRGDKRAFKQLMERIDVHGVSAGLGLWLEYRYGWRILLKEIDAVFDYMSELEASLEGLLRRERDRGASGGDLVSSTTLQPLGTFLASFTAPHYRPIIYGKREVRAASYTVEALVFYTLTVDAARARPSGLSAAPTLWELLPLSYVADWFTNVGTWLQAYASSVPGMTIVGAQEALKTRIIHEVRVTSAYMGNPSTGTSVTQHEPASVSSFRFKRELYNANQPVLPSLFNNMNLLRCIDAVALLHGRFGRLTHDASLWRFKLPNWS